MSNELQAEAEELKAYAAQHPELGAAKHHVFDEIRPKGAKPEFVVMGINPGESNRPEGGWTKRICEYTEDRPFVMTELFFWSSKDRSDLERRYGPIETHLPFCIGLNKRLIAHYRPKAVLCPGLGMIRLCVGANRFSLTHERTERRSPPNGSARIDRVYEVYRGKDGIPWFFTRHWTGARGFPNAYKELIKEALRQETLGNG